MEKSSKARLKLCDIPLESQLNQPMSIKMSTKATELRTETGVI